MVTLTKLSPALLSSKYQKTGTMHHRAKKTTPTNTIYSTPTAQTSFLKENACATNGSGNSSLNSFHPESHRKDSTPCLSEPPNPILAVDSARQTYYRSAWEETCHSLHPELESTDSILFQQTLLTDISLSLFADEDILTPIYTIALFRSILDALPNS